MSKEFGHVDFFRGRAVGDGKNGVVNVFCETPGRLVECQDIFQRRTGLDGMSRSEKQPPLGKQIQPSSHFSGNIVRSPPGQGRLHANGPAECEFFSELFLEHGNVHFRRRRLNDIINIKSQLNQTRQKPMTTAAHVLHHLGAEGMSHLIILTEFRGKVSFENIHSDHGTALISEVFSNVGEIDQSVSRFEHPSVHFQIETEAGLHDFEINRTVFDQVDQHLLHSPGSCDAVDKIKVACGAAANGKSFVANRFRLGLDRGVVEPVRRRKMGAIQIFQVMHARKRKVTRFQIFPVFELGVLIPFSEVTFDASIGKCAKFRSTINRFHITEIIADNAQKLFPVAQAKVVHKRPVDLRRRFMFDWYPIISGTIQRRKNPFPRGHGRVCHDQHPLIYLTFILKPVGNP